MELSLLSTNFKVLSLVVVSRPLDNWYKSFLKLAKKLSESPSDINC